MLDLTMEEMGQNARNIFDWFAIERGAVLELAVALLAAAIILLKLLTYKECPLMTSVLDYLSVLSR